MKRYTKMAERAPYPEGIGGNPQYMPFSDSRGNQNNISRRHPQSDGPVTDSDSHEYEALRFERNDVQTQRDPGHYHARNDRALPALPVNIGPVTPGDDADYLTPASCNVYRAGHQGRSSSLSEQGNLLHRNTETSVNRTPRNVVARANTVPARQQPIGLNRLKTATAQLPDKTYKYEVTTLETPITVHCGLPGKCRLEISPSEFRLRHKKTGTAYDWPYSCIRRFSSPQDHYFEFEGGRASASGPGVVQMKTNKAKEILEIVAVYVARC